MNNNDKKEFEEWFKDFWGEEYDSYRGHHKFQEIAWQTACNYKQNDIDRIKQIMQSEAMLNTSLSRDNKKLQAENIKLKECVEFYANGYATEIDDSCITQSDNGHIRLSSGKRARQVLKELDGNYEQ